MKKKKEKKKAYLLDVFALRSQPGIPKEKIILKITIPMICLSLTYCRHYSICSMRVHVWIFIFIKKPTRDFADLRKMNNQNAMSGDCSICSNLSSNRGHCLCTLFCLQWPVVGGRAQQSAVSPNSQEKMALEKFQALKNPCIFCNLICG